MIAQFNVAIKWHSVYRLPFHEGIICARLRSVIDLGRVLINAWGNVRFQGECVKWAVIESEGMDF
jgi:hypothetical protein